MTGGRVVFKRILPIVALGVLAIVVIFIINNTARLGEGPLYIEKGNAWSSLGKDPVERVCVMFKNGDSYVLTQNEANHISFPLDYFTEKEGKRISDVMCIIHNHLGLSRFSRQDVIFYNFLKTKGFRGFFLLKLGNGRVIDYEEWAKRGESQ
jgi:hypothetical protein